jgi:hypothetical protein
VIHSMQYELELLDSVLAQPGLLGECLLGQPGCKPVLPKQVTEGQGRAHCRGGTDGQI